MHNAWLCLFAVLGLIGCKKAQPPAPSLPPPRLSGGHLEVALVGLKKPLPEATVRAALEPVVTKVPGRSLELEVVKREEYPGLNESSLPYSAHLLTPEDRAALEKAESVVRALVVWRREDAQALREVYEALATLGSQHGALLNDRETVTVFSAADFRTRRINRGWKDGLIAGPFHFQVHLVPEKNGLIMMDTGGLSRFGISDFILLDVNRSSVDAAGDLMNAVAQRLIEGGRPDERGRLLVAFEDLKESALREALMKRASLPGAQRKLTVGFAISESPEARPGVPELTFPELTCEGRGKCLEGAMSALFGTAKDPAEAFVRDEKVHEAQARAKEALRRYRSKVRKGLPPEEGLLVKAPFPYADGTEWMWVDVHSWKGDTLRGRLENEPQYADVEPGSDVEVSFEDVMDYMYKLKDGSFYGNETGKLLFPERYEDAGMGRVRSVPKP